MEITERDVGDVVILTLHGRLVLEEVEAELRARFDDVIERGRVKVVAEPARCRVRRQRRAGIPGLEVRQPSPPRRRRQARAGDTARRRTCWKSPGWRVFSRHSPPTTRRCSHFRCQPAAMPPPVITSDPG